MGLMLLPYLRVGQLLGISPNFCIFIFKDVLFYIYLDDLKILKIQLRFNCYVMILTYGSIGHIILYKINQI